LGSRGEVTLIALFQDLAQDTWERLRDAHVLGMRIGEAGITDLLLLEIKRANLPNLTVLKTPNNLEPDQGTDWEWWIGSPCTGWLRYAVQAKKLYTSTRSYSALGHKVGGVPQIDTLEQYATVNGAIPLYCFFNHCDWVDLVGCWQCRLPRQDSQLGCTISPSFVVRQALANRGQRTFEFIHSHSQSLPWRCLVGCPLLRLLYRPDTVEGKALAVQMFDREITVYPQLPPGFETAIGTGETAFLSPEFYSEEAGSHPRRILVADFSAADVIPIAVGEPA
jgi:hypothetical protein